MRPNTQMLHTIKSQQNIPAPKRMNLVLFYLFFFLHLYWLHGFSSGAPLRTNFISYAKTEALCAAPSSFMCDDVACFVNVNIPQNKQTKKTNPLKAELRTWMRMRRRSSALQVEEDSCLSAVSCGPVCVFWGAGSWDCGAGSPSVSSQLVLCPQHPGGGSSRRQQQQRLSADRNTCVSSVSPEPTWQRRRRNWPLTLLWITTSRYRQLTWDISSTQARFKMQLFVCLFVF